MWVLDAKLLDDDFRSYVEFIEYVEERYAMGHDDTESVIHEVRRHGNLFFLLSAFVGAVNRFSDEVGDGLHAIALALATKDDNSAEIKELAEKVKAVRVKLKTAVDNQSQGE